MSMGDVARERLLQWEKHWKDTNIWPDSYDKYCDIVNECYPIEFEIMNVTETDYDILFDDPRDRE